MKHLKSFARFVGLLSVMGALALFTTHVVYARDAALPFRFSPNTPALASQMMANLDELVAALATKLDREEFEVAHEALVAADDTLRAESASLRTELGTKLDRSEAGSLGGGGAYAVISYGTAGSANVTLSNILVNGTTIGRPVLAGSSVQLTFNWAKARNAGCPGCVEQVLVGFTTAGDVNCVHSGGSSSNTNGSANITLTAPSTPGTYFVGVDRGQFLGCRNSWWSGRPGHPGQYLAVITVL